MNEERTGEFLQQVEHIRDHLLYIYSIAVNHGDDRKIFEVMTSTYQRETLGSVDSQYFQLKWSN